MVGQTGTLWRFRLLVPAVVLLLPLFAAISIAGDRPADEPVATEAPAASVAAEATDSGPNYTTTVNSTSVDQAHDLFERNILEQVVRLDNFFGNVQTESYQKSEYQIRWRNSVRIEKGGRINFGTTLRANIQLTKLNERLRLVVVGENEPEPFSSSLPEDRDSPVFDRKSQSIRVVNTELRYGLIQTRSLDMFLGAGVRLILPPEAFVRSRLQYIYNISDDSLLRLGETIFVKNLGRLGETSQVDLERLLSRKTLLRWANSGTFTDEIKGLEWGTEVSLIKELSPKSGITLAGGVYGNTSVNGAVENYRILARYRRNFVRSWLFYELEPEISWPRRADGGYPTNLALTLRLEVVFQGKE
jgi:hypothetical protein